MCIGGHLHGENRHFPDSPNHLCKQVPRVDECSYFECRPLDGDESVEGHPVPNGARVVLEMVRFQRLLGSSNKVVCNKHEAVYCLATAHLSSKEIKSKFAWTVIYVDGKLRLQHPSNKFLSADGSCYPHWGQNEGEVFLSTAKDESSLKSCRQ